MKTATATIQPAPANPARDKLRAAIEDKHNAEGAVAAARNAIEAARDRFYDMVDQLDRIENPQIQDSDEENGAVYKRDVGANFSEALQAGRVLNVDELLPDDDEQEKIAKLKRNIETWRRTVKSCEAALPEKEQAVLLAIEQIEMAAGEVVRAAAGGGILEALMDGIEEMQSIVLMRRLQLHFLACNKLIPEADVDRVMAVLAPIHMPARPIDVYFREWHQHPAWLAWKSALDALHGDPDAALPEYET